jgi:hypothetical protein
MMVIPWRLTMVKEERRLVDGCTLTAEGYP